MDKTAKLIFRMFDIGEGEVLVKVVQIYTFKGGTFIVIPQNYLFLCLGCCLLANSHFTAAHFGVRGVRICFVIQNR